MKHVINLFGLAAIPFLLVWFVFLLTGFAFNPITGVFVHAGYWVLTSLYWVIIFIAYAAAQEHS